MILETWQTEHLCEQCWLYKDATNSSFQLIPHTLSSRLSQRLHILRKRRDPHSQWRNTWDVKPTPPTPTTNNSCQSHYYKLAKKHERRATSPTPIDVTKYLMSEVHILVTRILRPTHGNCDEKPTASKDAELFGSLHRHYWWDKGGVHWENDCSSSRNIQSQFTSAHGNSGALQRWHVELGIWYF